MFTLVILYKNLFQVNGWGACACEWKFYNQDSTLTSRAPIFDIFIKIQSRFVLCLLLFDVMKYICFMKRQKKAIYDINDFIFVPFFWYIIAKNSQNKLNFFPQIEQLRRSSFDVELLCEMQLSVRRHSVCIREGHVEMWLVSLTSKWRVVFRRRQMKHD